MFHFGSPLLFTPAIHKVCARKTKDCGEKTK